jgi:hypothetical protein
VSVIRQTLVFVLVAMLVILVGGCGATGDADKTTTAVSQAAVTESAPSVLTAAEYRTAIDQWDKKIDELGDGMIRPESAANQAAKWSAEDVAFAEQYAAKVQDVIAAAEAVKAPAEYSEVHSLLLDVLRFLKTSADTLSASAPDGVVTVEQVKSKLDANAKEGFGKMSALSEKAQAAGLTAFVLPSE